MKPRVMLLSQEVHPIPPTHGAAVEQWIDAVAHRLSDYAPRVLSVPHPTRPDDEQEGELAYHRIRIGRLYTRLFKKLTRLDPWSYADRVAAYARREQPALIHVHNHPRLAAALKTRLATTPVVLHMHNDMSAAPDVALDAIVGCSDYVTGLYRQRPWPARQYATLPNGVDTARFKPVAAEAKGALRARLGLPADRRIILFAGRISEEKGPDIALEVFRHLDPSHYHLVLVGEVQTRGGGSRVKFGQAVLDNLQALGGAATYLGKRSPQEMAEIYPAVDALFIPSRFEEPFSMVAIEAMACGVPVLAYRRGGMPEYMDHGRNAMIIDPQMPIAEVAAVVHRSLADGALLSTLSREARALVESRFDWREVARQTSAFYDQLLENRR